MSEDAKTTLFLCLNAAGVVFLLTIFRINWPRNFKEWAGDMTPVQLFFGGGGIGGFALGLATIIVGIYTVRALLRRLKIDQATYALAERTHRLAQSSDVAVRFQKGLELLANDSEAVRSGAIHLLGTIAREWPSEYADVVANVLVDFLNRQCADDHRLLQAGRTPFNPALPLTDAQVDRAKALRYSPPADVIAAVSALGDRAWAPFRSRSISLRGLVLGGTNFDDLDFGDSEIIAICVGTMFRNCHFNDSILGFELLNGGNETFGARLDRCLIDRTVCSVWSREVAQCEVYKCSLDHAAIMQAEQSRIRVAKSLVEAATFRGDGLAVKDCWAYSDRPHHYGHRLDDEAIFNPADGVELEVTKLGIVIFGRTAADVL